MLIFEIFYACLWNSSFKSLKIVFSIVGSSHSRTWYRERKECANKLLSYFNKDRVPLHHMIVEVIYFIFSYMYAKFYLSDYVRLPLPNARVSHYWNRLRFDFHRTLQITTVKYASSFGSRHRVTIWKTWSYDQGPDLIFFAHIKCHIIY